MRQQGLIWLLFATLMGFALGGSFTWGIMYSPPQQYAANDHEANEHPTEKGNKNGFWEKAREDPVAYFTLWLVGFTAVLAVSTIGLWIVTWRASASQARDMTASIAAAEKSVDIARQAMIAGERAFVFATGVMPFWEFDKPSGLYHWRFRPNWKNSGDTPTRRMTMHSECFASVTTLPVGFDFDYQTTEMGTALIPPNTETMGGMAPRYPAPAITPQDIFDVQAGTKFLYFIGWAKYFDVFPDTPQHITRVCWRLLPLGDPFAYDPNVAHQGLTFPNIYHTEGNCADDECQQRRAVAFAP